NADLRQTLKQAIELEGHGVHGGRNGQDGIDFLNTATTLPDMIICDISMPDMNGFEFLERVRGNKDWAKIRFVVMSGTRSDREIPLKSGADGYLGKPFGFTELKSLVDQIGKG